MKILRIFIHNEELAANTWHLLNNGELTGEGVSSLSEILTQEFDQVEVLIAPQLATIIKVDLGEISDRKINESLLLSLVEEQVAEDVEDCKPILMRLNDGEAYVAIVNRSFHTKLIASFSEHIKSIKYIQPFPYATAWQANEWCIHLREGNKFIRTGQYDYFLLDDGQPLPLLLEQMLPKAQIDGLLIYTDTQAACDYIQAKFNLNCRRIEEYNYTNITWNFYNEKSRRFNIKLTPSTRNRLISLAKLASGVMLVFMLLWLSNLVYLISKRSQLQHQIRDDLKGVVSINKFTPNLLDQVDDQLEQLAHTKGVYAPDDFSSLFEEFLRTVPNVNNSMIVGVKYSASQLLVFLNAQFDPSRFFNDRSILATKRIDASVEDYKTYQAAQSKNNQNNNAGVLDTAGTSGTSQAMADVAWVVSLQIISRMEGTQNGRDVPAAAR